MHKIADYTLSTKVREGDLMSNWPGIDLKKTGKNISDLRKKSGLSVRDLQREFGFTTPQAIYKWQNGRTLPSIDNLVGLSVLLNVTIDEILIVEDACGGKKDE